MQWIQLLPKLCIFLCGGCCYTVGMVALLCEVRSPTSGWGSPRLVRNTTGVYPKTKEEKLHPKLYFSCQHCDWCIWEQRSRPNSPETTDHPNGTVNTSHKSEDKSVQKWQQIVCQLSRCSLNCCSSPCGFADTHASKFSHYLMSQTGNKLWHKHTKACGSHYTHIYTHSNLWEVQQSQLKQPAVIQHLRLFRILISSEKKHFVSLCCRYQLKIFKI